MTKVNNLKHIYRFGHTNSKNSLIHSLELMCPNEKRKPTLKSINQSINRCYFKEVNNNNNINRHV